MIGFYFLKLKKKTLEFVAYEKKKTIKKVSLAFESRPVDAKL